MGNDHVKGHVDLILLGILSQSPRHGYEVITALRERTDGTLDLTEGSIYPALRRLEDAGLLTSDWQQIAGRRRRVYRTTPVGTRALKSQEREWRAFVTAVEAVLRPTAPHRVGA